MLDCFAFLQLGATEAWTLGVFLVYLLPQPLQCRIQYRAINALWYTGTDWHVILENIFDLDGKEQQIAERLMSGHSFTNDSDV